MAYSVWDSLSEKVYEGRTEPSNEEGLKTRILESWEAITIKEIKKKAIGSWKKRLRAVCNQDGDPISHVKFYVIKNEGCF